jgi:CheY-like chemotaxis protein
MTKIILCADDSVTMQQVAEITFKGTDYTYVGARSADEALAKAKQQKPVLVLADAVMPGKTGYELCQAIKSDGGLADVPVVILCGNSQAYDPARGAQVGADGTLSKPWDTQVMLDKIGEFVEKGSTARVAAPAAAAPAKPATPAVVPPAAAAAVNPALAGQRSATIMGMPSIKLPPQMGAAPVTAPVAPPPVAPKAPEVAKVASPNIVARQPAPASQPPPLKPAPAAADAGPGRAPLVAGIPTKRSALVERTLARMAARLAELSGLEPGSPELLALLKLSTEVVERIVWEVVPDLAEQIIRENLNELAAARRN